MGSLDIIIVVIVPLISCSSFEPQCSKFHYEEKLLEKMIRQEFSVQALRKEIETYRNQVQTALNTLQNERIIWEKRLQAKSDQSNTDLAAVIQETKTKVREEMTKLENEKTKWNSELKAKSDKSATDLAAVYQETKTKVQEEMTKLENEKNKWNSELKDFAKIPKIVLFSARNPKDTTIKVGLTMIFTEVLMNEGGAYNKENGVFTVPYAGVYTFSVQLCIYPRQFTDFAFMANNKPFKRARSHGLEYFTCFSFDAVTIVGLNDQVFIKVTNCSPNQVFGENYSYWNVFSGRLLYTS